MRRPNQGDALPDSAWVFKKMEDEEGEVADCGVDGKLPGYLKA